MRRFLLFLVSICSLLAWVAVPVWAEEDWGLELTLEEVVEKALLHSDSLKIGELELQKNEEQKDEAGYALARFGSRWVTEYIPGVEAFFVASERSKLAYEVARRKQVAAKDNIVLAAHKAYYDVLRKEAQVLLATLAVEKDQLNLKNARVSHANGLISQQTLMGMETQLSASEAALASAKVELDKAYRGLNLLVGLPEDAKPQLVSKVEFVPFTGDVDVQISLALDGSPDVFAAVENAKLTRRLQGWDESIRSEDIEMAELKASIAKDKTRDLVRILYYTVRNMEGNYPAALESVRLAQENLRVTRLKLELGMATKRELKEAEWRFAEAQQKLLQLMLDHAYYKLALEKPWAYSPSAGIS